jgi:hypothetical protein
MAFKHVLEVFRGAVLKGKRKYCTLAAKIGNISINNGSSAPIVEKPLSAAKGEGFWVWANIAALIAFVAFVPAALFKRMYRASTQQPQGSVHKLAVELSIERTSTTNRANNPSTPPDNQTSQVIDPDAPPLVLSPVPARTRMNTASPASPARAPGNQPVSLNGYAWHVASACLVPDTSPRSSANSLSPASAPSEQSTGTLLDFSLHGELVRRQSGQRLEM